MIPHCYENTNVKFRRIVLNNLFDNLIWKDDYLNNLVEKLKKIVDVDEVEYYLNNNTVINKTRDLLSIIAHMYITSSDEDNLTEAVRIARDWEKNLGKNR